MEKDDKRFQFKSIVETVIGFVLVASVIFAVFMANGICWKSERRTRALYHGHLAAELVSTSKKSKYCRQRYAVTPEDVWSVGVADPLNGPDLYRFYISQICEQYYPEIDPYIVLAVLEMESNYQPNVESSAGAVGLMQVIPKYHAWRAEKYHLIDIWDPYTNIIVGVDFMNDLYQKYGDWNRALLGYNNSVHYVKAVLRRAELLRGCGYFG